MEESFYQQLGGTDEAVIRLVSIFYDLIAKDPVLKPIFPEDLTEPKRKQSLYFIEFFGGKPLYTKEFGKAFLRFKHRHAVIGPSERDAWLTRFREAMGIAGVPEPVQAAILEKLQPIADFMMNSMPGKRDAQYFNTPSSTLS